jgi:hypothetical protein
MLLFNKNGLFPSTLTGHTLPVLVTITPEVIFYIIYPQTVIQFNIILFPILLQE